MVFGVTQANMLSFCVLCVCERETEDEELKTCVCVYIIYIKEACDLSMKQGVTAACCFAAGGSVINNIARKENYAGI